MLPTTCFLFDDSYFLFDNSYFLSYKKQELSNKKLFSTKFVFVSPIHNT
jgi:hypothetical protein